VPESTFGAAIAKATPAELLAAEATTDRGDRFAELDNFIATLLQRAFAGHRLLDVTYGNRGTRTETVAITGLTAAHRAFLDDGYRLDRQEARGAWYLPQEATLKVGLCNLPAHFATQPRFAVAAARDEAVKVSLRTCPDALAVWALLIPVFSDLLAPIDVRTATGQAKPADQQRQAWTAIDATYAALGLNLEAELRTLRYGGGWGRLRLADQVLAMQALIAALARQVSVDTARRWRARTTLDLVAGYYRKARSGPPLARSVLTAAYRQRLSGVFAGDWLAFLSYLGEPPNPAEKIATALPEPRLYVTTSSETAAVAAEHGLPTDEVERMLAAYLGQTAGSSPVEERVAAMRRWWGEFDALHARQRPGMAPLWGLVDEGLVTLDDERAPAPYLYRQLLSPELTAEIDRLWDGVTLARWPERIVSEFHPHQQMAEAFGPAVELWNEIALTCWFVCEGPMSRTTLGALGKYHHRQVVALDEMGFPIDRAIFRELEHAENRLSPPEQAWEDEEVWQLEPEVGVTISMGGTQRREGFELLRDVVTRHRRAWAARHLDGYLHHRWDSELRQVSHEYSRRLAAAGKPPTLRQFASIAAPAANHWFGGDLAALYAALGEQSPGRPARIDLLPGDPLVFVRAVYAAIGGGPPLPPEAAWQDHEAYQHQWELRGLASEALRYLQLQEALDRPPTPKEFGAERFRWDQLGGSEAGWARYETAIQTSRSAPASPKPPHQPAWPTPQPPPPPTPLPVTPPQPNDRRQQRRRGWIDRLRGH
jgi:hypothetical protein